MSEYVLRPLQVYTLLVTLLAFFFFNLYIYMFTVLYYLDLESEIKVDTDVLIKTCTTQHWIKIKILKFTAKAKCGGNESNKIH